MSRSNQGSTRKSVGREAASRRASHRLRPGVLTLEDRRLLATFTVTNPADILIAGLPAPNTLRWAISQANAATTPSTIAFSLGSTPATITLAQGQLRLTNTTAPIAIQGPGSGLLAIDGDDASRILQLDRGVEASISGLEFTHGNSGSGGAIANSGSLSLRGCLFLDNVTGPRTYYSQYSSSTGPGIGGAISNYNGILDLVDCTLTGNRSNFGGAIDNSALYGFSQGTWLPDV